MTTKTKFKPGDRVKVPWGLTQLVGTVLEVYGLPGSLHVVVEVPVEGTRGEVLETTTVSYDASDLEPAA